MAGIIGKLFGWPTTFVFAFAFTTLLSLSLWPASWWMDVRSISVFDSREGEKITLVVDRTISKSFVGTWNVIVRKMGPEGVTVHCTAGETSNYRSDATLPNPLTLDWWTSGRCSNLPEGRYILTTVWSFPGLGGLTQKTVSVDSNPFIVSVPAAGIGEAGPVPQTER